MSPDGSKSTPPPEEKLLRLIRGKGAEPAPQAAAPTVVGARLAGPPASSTIVRASEGRRWKAPAWSLMAVNVVLGCVAVGLLMAIALVAFGPSPSVGVAVEAPVENSPGEPPEREASPPETPSGPSAAPLSAAAARPLFVTPVSPGTAARAASVPLSQQAKELAGRLSVLGIVEGEPRQAIIEDAQTKKTYFVSVGQQVVDGMVVTEVRTDRVVLDVDGQHLELSL